MSESGSESADSWIGSDATSHQITDEDGFDVTSLIAIAIAVENRSEFNRQYREVLARKSEEYGISIKRPVLKTHELWEGSTEWDYENIVSDFVGELLEIDCISNIHITITTLDRQTAPAYQQQPNSKKYLGPKEIENEISNYYNLISVWDYLDEYSDAPWGTTNVLLDDFEGKDNEPWRRIGRISNKLMIIPQGDYTYPILSLADLTMDYIKGNIETWSEESIQAELEDVTPDDSAFVNTKSLSSQSDIEKLTPISRRNIERKHHYPHPTIFIDRNGIDREKLRRFDIYHTISDYAYDNSGCIKYFNEHSDGGIIRDGDYIVCLGDDTSEYSNYKNLNKKEAPELLDVDAAFEEFS